MKKLFLIIGMFFICYDFVFAANEMKYVDSTGEYYVIINKEEFRESPYVKNELRSMYSYNFNLPPVVAAKTYENVYITTYEKDAVLNDPEKWWGQITVCVTGSDLGLMTKILSLDFYAPIDVNAFAFTDVSDSKLAEQVMKANGGLIDDDDDYIEWYEGIFGETVKKCMVMTPSENIASENLTDPCNVYDKTKEKIDNILADYDQKSSIEKAQIISDYKTYINQLKISCKSIMQNLDVDQTCVKRCFGIQNDISNWKHKMEISNAEGVCGFSGRLITFVANIIRWLKYIIPVIVIVLGILDFMKAMGADKEDEMKKAQQRFIRRLIAAALIFLIPIIIEFILNKMGFDANGCGIINL